MVVMTNCMAKNYSNKIYIKASLSLTWYNWARIIKRFRLNKNEVYSLHGLFQALFWGNVMLFFKIQEGYFQKERENGTIFEPVEGVQSSL